MKVKHDFDFIKSLFKKRDYELLKEDHIGEKWHVTYKMPSYFGECYMAKIILG
jgi:hypothetical protein